MNTGRLCDTYTATAHTNTLPGPQVPKHTNEAVSEFCSPNYKGCYMCEECWFEGQGQSFWHNKDLNPDDRWLSQDEDSPFLLSID
jgi:hypothetical protein